MQNSKGIDETGFHALVSTALHCDVDKPIQRCFRFRRILMLRIIHYAHRIMTQTKLINEYLVLGHNEHDTVAKSYPSKESNISSGSPLNTPSKSINLWEPTAVLNEWINKETRFLWSSLKTKSLRHLLCSWFDCLVESEAEISKYNFIWCSDVTMERLF